MTKEEIKSGFGISALVCGILSLLISIMPYFGLPLAILAIIFAAKQKPSTGLAISGKVLGIIGCCINGVIILLMALVVLIGFSL